MTDKKTFTFLFEAKKNDKEIGWSKEVINMRGYKKAVKSFQNKYSHVEVAIVSWIKKGKELSKIQKLPLGRKKKLGG